MSQQEEREYYRSNAILITSARAEIGERTFSMANVTAVSMGTIPANTGCAVVLLIVGGLTILGGLAAIGSTVAPLILGILIAGAGWMWLKSLKPTFVVNLGSASGEARAYQSRNRDEVAEIVNAIKRAIIDRG
jgi:hypothetical protein